MPPCFLYILYSESLDKYYIGISADPDKRLKYHNQQTKGWTQRGRPWRLVFKKQFPSQTEAHYWELRLKRIKKRAVIDKIISGSFIWH